METKFVEKPETLMFKNPDGLKGETAKVVSSRIEQFEALTNWKADHFDRPMVLLFDQPWLLHLVNFNFKFPVDVILVDEEGIVRNAFTEPFRNSGASYIRGFSSVKMVILCQKNDISKYKIVKNVTIIELTTSEIFNNHRAEAWKNEYGKLTMEELENAMKIYRGVGQIGMYRIRSLEYQVMKQVYEKKVRKNKVYTLDFHEEDEVKLVFVSLIVNVESINRVFGELQDFAQEYQIEGYTNGKLFMICDMMCPSEEIGQVVVNCLRPLGLKERTDFVVAEEVMVNSPGADPVGVDISYWNQEHPQLRHLDWLGSICLSDGNWIWHK